jgi:putative PIG3 family NAD(P)H quinone oxidoreductase
MTQDRSMHAVVAVEPGGPEVLAWREVDDPRPGSDEVLIRVAAAGVNRADLLQRQGHYPPPAGTSPLLGLEVSGTVVGVGEDVQGVGIGDEVAALLTGGGYAELVAVPAVQVLPVPGGTALVTAAALPEVTCTVWSNLVMTAALVRGEWLLVHGGSSGIGTCALQIARALGVHTVTTVGTAEKAEAVRALGAEHVCNYRADDFVEVVQTATDGRGVDVVLDVIGAKYLDRNLRCLAAGGRLVVIGLQGGTRGELDLNRLMRTRASVHGTTLRARPTTEKGAIVDEVRSHVWPMVERGDVVPVVHEVFDMRDAAEAHATMAASQHIGKLLLVPPSPPAPLPASPR